ncbi:expressed unknown protein [Seminavis robusta]|uniref:Transmembrane protein n=1 Tax=Seminavis robusta TaxID=568900 RepID=A0A9N8HA18_9STRA|nr:expressed unknown protein [Seminavis robusta]|eukprot:Sro301_g111980.1 n/a (374) ;mRNA; f:47113-48234
MKLFKSFSRTTITTRSSLLPWPFGIILLATLQIGSTLAFSRRYPSIPAHLDQCQTLLSTRVHPFPTHPKCRPPLLSTASDALLEAIQSDPQDEAQIASCIEDLEAANPLPPIEEDAKKEDFDPLLGLYEVSFVKTKRPKDNPVGGKWTRKTGIAQKLLRTRRSFQHLVPTNSTGLTKTFSAVGEAINVISLEAFAGILRISVILRGDAIPLTLAERSNTTRVVQPLTPLAVKALFDSPRIFIGRTGRIALSVGPKTSVLLDCLFCDDNIRLGMGGTSGSRFVFKRCSSDDEEANEFQALLQKPLPKRYKSFLSLGGIAALGVLGVARGFLRILSGTVAAIALSMAALIAFSGGGIEQGDMGVTMAKEEKAKAN